MELEKNGSYLGAEIALQALLADGFLAAGQGLEGLLFQAHPASQHQQRPEIPRDQPGERFWQKVQVDLDAAAAAFACSQRGRWGGV